MILEGENFKLAIDLDEESVKILWDELELRVRTTEDVNLQDIAIRTMVLLYKQYHELIGAVRSMEYWLNFLKETSNIKLQFTTL